MREKALIVAGVVLALAGLTHRTAAEAAAGLPEPSSPTVGADQSAEELDRLNRRVRELYGQRKYAEAASLAERGLRIAEKLFGPNHIVTGSVAALLAEIHEARGLNNEALPLYRRALTISETAEGPSHPNVVRNLNNLALLLKSMGHYQEALQLTQRALRLAENAEQPDQRRIAILLNNLGDLYREMALSEKALPMYFRALSITREIEGPHGAMLGTMLNNLALAYHALGRYEEALNSYRQAMGLSQSAPGVDHPESGMLLTNLGELYRSMGRYQEALDASSRALIAVERAVGPEHPTVGLLLSNLGLVYSAIGQFDQALLRFQRALIISERFNGVEHPLTGVILMNLAALHREMGQYEDALPLYQRALSAIESAQGREHKQTGAAASNLAGLYHDLGRYEESLQLHRRALEISEKANGAGHPLTGWVLTNLAWLYADMELVEPAQPLLQRALAIASGSGEPSLASNVYRNLMYLHSRRIERSRALRNPALAIWYGKQAVNTLQAVRGQLHGLDRDLQGSFLAKNKPTYEHLANLLIESGRIAEAEQVLAMLKEREVFELIRASGASTSSLQTTFDGVERAALAEQQRLEAEGVRQSQQLASLEHQRKALGTLPEADEVRRQALLVQAQVWRASYQRFLGSLNGRFGARAGQAREADQQSTRLQARVALDPAGAIGLHYVVTDERIGIIVATPRGSFGRFSNVSRTDLERQIVALRQALFAKADTRPAAQALWKMLIEPVQADVRASGARTLVLSLTDNLRYLPFAALQAPDGRYLVQDYAVAVWAAAADVTPGPGRAVWQVAGLGLSEARPGFSALPAVPEELAAIVRTSPADPDGVLPGTVALDEQFTRQRFEQALSGQANVLHVASHFDFKPGDESRSILLLGQGDSISLGQLAVMDFSEIEQLTLSACDTATGGGLNENGAEVEGLAAIVLRQRASAVLATLWKVADASTARLMRDFYAKRSAENGLSVSRAQALRQAQLAMLQGAASALPAEPARGVSRVNATGQALIAQPADPGRPWAHPYYWAPFVLSGNWL